MSTIDVVVPCYNYARYLPTCIGSVLNQPGVDARVLIIDDTSKDDSQQVGEALARADARVTYRRHPKNLGHIATYNEGLLGWCAADYSVLLSADDVLAPDSLQRAADLLDRNADAGMAYGLAVYFKEDAELPALRDAVRVPAADARIVESEPFLARCFASGNPVPTPTAVVRTSLQQRLGGYRADLPHSGDMEMWMRFAAHAKVGAVNSVQAFYRAHDANMSIAYNEHWVSDRREQLAACREIVEKASSRFAGLDKQLEQMSLRLAFESLNLASKAYDHGDSAAAATCLKFAFEFNPSLRATTEWRKYQVKGLLGNRMWRALLPLWSRIRGSTDVGSWPPQVQSSRQLGRRHGWWPDNGGREGERLPAQP